MAITPGTRLGPYEVTAQIGVGGMGEVYRATDTNLARQVAIKVLPEAVAADADRLARFDREAKTLASLNHPNIAAIYGLERSGATTALVMELVEGRYYTGDTSYVTRHYDVSPDGQRFLMIKESGTGQTAAPPLLIVVQHFDEELKRLVPTK